MSTHSLTVELQKHGSKAITNSNSTAIFEWLWQLSYQGQFAPVHQSPTARASDVFSWKVSSTRSNYWLVASVSQAIKQSEQVLYNMSQEKSFILVYESPQLVHLIYYKDKKVSKVRFPFAVVYPCSIVSDLQFHHFFKISDQGYYD
jgi:hypothetical protein